MFCRLPWLMHLPIVDYQIAFICLGSRVARSNSVKNLICWLEPCSPCQRSLLHQRDFRWNDLKSKLKPAATDDSNTVDIYILDGGLLLATWKVRYGFSFHKHTCSDIFLMYFRPGENNLHLSIICVHYSLHYRPVVSLPLWLHPSMHTCWWRGVLRETVHSKSPWQLSL